MLRGLAKNSRNFQQKTAIAASNSCQNCLRLNYQSDQCSSQSRCKTCQGKHHTILQEAFNARPGAKACNLTRKFSQMTILLTARVQLFGRNKRIRNLRALLVTGAHINAVTAKAFKTMGLEPKPSNERIIGVNQKDSMPVDGSLKLKIIPKTGENITLNYVVLKKITASENPNHPLSEIDYADLVNYNLADDQFWQSGKIDILLGISAYTQIIKGQILKQGSLCLTENTLGWTVSGLANLESTDKPSVKSNAICLLANEIKSFAKFWEIEDVPALFPAMFTPKELASINHYDTTTTYGQIGRPQVRLPIDQHKAIFDPDSQEWLPDIEKSSRKAIKQFLGNENKLSRTADSQTQYTEFFQKMLETGHLEPVNESDHNLPPEKHFVMQHHAVWKSSSTTTKCRAAVFNASAKTTNGKNLNDCLLVGPKQKPDLFLRC